MINPASETAPKILDLPIGLSVTRKRAELYDRVVVPINMTRPDAAPGNKTKKSNLRIATRDCAKVKAV